jgi:predicted enzyme related to lactoylglutathione lyase
MRPVCANPVVHLELHTGNLSRACAFYTRLFGWRAERIAAGGGSYLALGLGDGIDGGVVERDTERSLWLPYVEVADVAQMTEQARLLGAAVLIEPREGPAGWRSVLAAPAGAGIALWQPKPRAGRRL